MDTKKIAKINDISVEINGEKNVLELIRKAGFDLPTFCYYPELSTFGACRMCVFEDDRGNLDAGCSAQPWDGMVIKTNTAKIRKHRKIILELLLANHCTDCTTCKSSGNCKLQELVVNFGITDVRFPNTAEPDIDNSSLCITKDISKCILCGDCVRMCHEIQNVGAIDFTHRGSKMTISTAFDEPLSDSNCVGCGLCTTVCPTGALIPHSDVDVVWKEINDPDVKLSAQIAPAVRVAIGEAFGLRSGENSMGKVVAALKHLGFDKVFDTSTGADFTVMEESEELIGRLKSGENLPLFTSCCPSWVQYCEMNYPEMLPNVSSCRSCAQMLASIVKAQEDDSDKRNVHISVMPCTAKKFEAARDEFKQNGVPDIDYVITTQELIHMIREAGISFSSLEPKEIDMPLGVATGAGVIFGVTGGVTEAVLRRLSGSDIVFQGVRGMNDVKETSIKIGDREVKIAIVGGLRNASNIIERVKQGEKYDFIEVMACPGGCVSGAGQPFASTQDKARRGEGLHSVDEVNEFKSSEESPVVKELYNGILKDKAHDLLHTTYKG